MLIFSTVLITNNDLVNMNRFLGVAQSWKINYSQKKSEK